MFKFKVFTSILISYKRVFYFITNFCKEHSYEYNLETFKIKISELYIIEFKKEQRIKYNRNRNLPFVLNFLKIVLQAKIIKTIPRIV